MIDKTRDESVDSKSKSFKKRIGKVFKFGSKSNRSDQNEKSKSGSVKMRFKSFLRRQRAEHSDECKWLLQQSSTQIYSGINESESDTKDKKKIKNQKKQKEKKNKEPKERKEKEKSKSLVKKVGKITVQTCRYISMSGSPGYGFNPTAHYNYETHSYDYYPYSYSDAQSCSPSMFF